MLSSSRHARAAARQKVTRVTSQSVRQRLQRRSVRNAVKRGKGAQHAGRIRRRAAQTSANRNALFDQDICSRRRKSGNKRCGRTVCVVFLRRQRIRHAAHAHTHFCIPASAHPYDVVQIDRADQRIDKMIAVRAADDIQRKIDLGVCVDGDPFHI